MSPVVEVLRTYLELRSPQQLKGAVLADRDVRFLPRRDITVAEYRRLYHDVGGRWYWRDRDAWTDARLGEHLSRPNVLIWECRVGAKSAGFFELERRDDGSVEIAYFGLITAFTGRGIGRTMLTRAAEEAWALGATRVWLHTCTLDSPHALPNYRARGFEEVACETYVVQLPDDDSAG